MNSPVQKVVCIIDDDAMLRSTLRNTLEDAGYLVFEACNGRTGVEMARQCNASLAVVDIVMPDQEGLATIRELTEQLPRIQILAISGFDQKYLNIAEQFGATDSLRKPFLGSELVSRLNRMLKD